MERLLCEHESGLWSDMVVAQIDPRIPETEGDAQDRFHPSPPSQGIPWTGWDFKHSEPRQRVF